MQEYWVNVYKNNIIGRKWNNRQQAIEIAQEDFTRNFLNYKPLYRIHVKLKEPEFKVIVTGNCGKPHTYQEWRVCGACNRPKPIKYERPLFGGDNWMG